jgi:DNA-binding NarL/FixJ family response regulator
MWVHGRSVMKIRRVIIADSSQNLLEGIRGLLETVFDSVVMVADVRSLIDTAGKIGADMAVVDLTFGDGHCADAVERIKSLLPDLKVLVLSLNDEEAALTRAIEAGADGFVLKRLAADDLIPAVELLLGGGSFASKIRKS